MDKSVLAEFRMEMAEKGIRMYGIKVENKEGDSVSHLWRSNDRISLYSASKTYTAIGVGIAIDEGLLDYDDKIMDFFPEYADIAAPGTEKITVRHLLRMTSGKLIRFFINHNDMDAFDTPEDWAAEFFRIPVTKEPGTFFSYSNTSPYMLSRVVEKVSGQTLLDYMKPRFFAPLKIYNPQWFTCPMGHTAGYSKIFLNLDEFSRLGTLLLHEGVYDGKQIVSKEFVHRMMSDLIQTNNTSVYTDTSDATGYGYFMWQCGYEDAFAASGRYGKSCIVIPGKGLTITYLAHEELRTKEIETAVFQTIVDPLYQSNQIVPCK